MTAEERIGSLRKFGWKLGLERMRALCARLGDPQDRLNVIHVAGTNGKGSVCRYLYETLLAHGAGVGLFTSPGLGDFRSRIEANGEWISKEDLENCTDEVLAAVEEMSGRGPAAGGATGEQAPTTAGDTNGRDAKSGGDANRRDAEAGDPPTEFEVLTTVALVYFASQNLDFVVLEVGLGGAADSTNIVSSPLVSVITEISFDHTEQLGDTIEEIAAEKAGIIKPGRPVVTSAGGAAAKVVARRAYELAAPFTDARVNSAGGAGGIRTWISSESLGGSVFSCEIRGTRYDDIEISMPGRHQIENAVCALVAFDVLRRMKQMPFPLRADAETLRRGLQTARLPGRFQIVSPAPLIILDGAHNRAGAAALRAAALALLPGKKNLALTAMMRDKRTDGILKEINGFADGIVFTRASNERSADPESLAAMWRAVSAASAATTTAAADANAAAATKTVEAVVADPREAYHAARALVEKGAYDALVVCGSLYLISDIMEAAPQEADK
jgi:dihydrofolate synthase/folylpolyglutamate synthase